MRWKGRRQSENVEDRRTMGRPAAVGGGIGIVLIAIVIGLLGGNPQQFLQQARQNQAAPGPGGEPAELTPEEQEAGEFVATVFADTEDVWTRLFADNGLDYRKPTLVLFKDHVRSGCGMASSGTGPFYCPADQKVYLDTSFFSQLSRQLGAPGDFAQAYVVAHEVGHHVQKLLGYTDQVDKIRQQVPEVEYNKYSVKLELQADFFAGVMLHHADRMHNIIERGDIEEALTAAQAIGDDTLQRRSKGYVQPETFNHGTSEQRVRWFSKGLKTGDLSQGDTFGAETL
ncbi:KPN_02809 family neutral zinc metallopeptidase [Rhodopirellula sallentina]|uniref:Neutral zinc metallopeptidase n=1 Tax=Rhodopirellula sallentina SM41 TaxID=1263870 RepID=M5U2T1_9BACT|nr:neutral zinc metallopeptidase [Rhodopirellula sallentina]EMI55762.1 neutral zinc metallopeptidase [Rhodopirellula sallentina SM41]